MKTFTHLDTGGHGYLKVSKKLFVELGGDPTKVTTCSGHTINTMYLEEDCDMTYFLQLLDAKGIQYKINSKYVNRGSCVSHNYAPEFFDWNYDTKVVLQNGFVATVSKNGDVLCDNGIKYLLPKSKLNRPFEYFKAVHLS